ncbi:MAG: acyl carrier protein [Oscillospiraceae bacterium]|nr:acyl carrier protein [Oscillospiraceae bacterium]
MNENEIRQSVRAIIVERISVNPADVLPSKLFAEDLGGDSLDKVEILMDLDKKFKINTTDESVEFAENLKTIGDIEDVVVSRVK